MMQPKTHANRTIFATHCEAAMAMFEHIDRVATEAAVMPTFDNRAGTEGYCVQCLSRTTHKWWYL